MKKKISATVQDKKDWFDFTQKKGKVYNKESELTDRDINKSKITKLDLHGDSIDKANKKVKEFIIKSFVSNIHLLSYVLISSKIFLYLNDILIDLFK